MITLPEIKGQNFVVLGLGKSGLATAAMLQASGALFTVWDDGAAARDEAAKLGYQLADPLTLKWQNISALILSPGIPLTLPAPHPAVTAAKVASVPVYGDVDLLFRACPVARYVGITGTNGKSTTTALIAHILQQAGHKVQVGGNLGTPVLSFDPLGSDGIYVLELSSYQLDLMQRNILNVAVFLNLTPDHLDRHGDMAGYLAAKARIIRKDAPQTVILGTDESETQSLFQAISRQGNLNLQEISIQHPIAQGVMARDNLMLHMKNNNPTKIIDFSELSSLPGLHNQQNACAAFAASKALGLDELAILAGLKSFPGLIHRQQLVATLNGVRFINDSKATNADAAAKALASYDNIYWIIGGKPKAGGLNGLEPYTIKIRHAFLIGAAEAEFANWCEGKIPYTRSQTLATAVAQAADRAASDQIPNAVVLLSPACASFDQFKSFEERGMVFIDLVNNLIN